MRTRTLLFATVLKATAAAAGQTPHASVAAGYWGGPGCTVGYTECSPCSGGTGLAGASWQAAYAPGQKRGNASVEPFRWSAEAIMHGSTQYPGTGCRGGDVLSRAEFLDSVVAVGGTGAGVARFTFLLAGSVAGTGSYTGPTPQVSLLVQAGGQQWSFNQSALGTNVVVDVPMTFTQAFSFDVRLAARAQTKTVGVLVSSQALLDLVSVEVLEDGVAVPHAIVRGASGRQYLGPVPGDIVRVAPGGTATAVGESWALATSDLNWALQLASLPNGGAAVADEIWVMEGEYRPDQGFLATPGNRAAAFAPPNGAVLRGGFEGHELSPEERPPAGPLAPQTILSADLLGDDQPGFQSRSDNAYQVVRLTRGGSPLLDRLTIQGGNAERTDPNYSPWRDHGGGIYVYQTNLRLLDCTIRDNEALYEGGAMVARTGYSNSTYTLTLDHCLVSGNRSRSRRGGALYTEPGDNGGGSGPHRNGKYNVVIRACTFEANRAAGSSTNGGGALTIHGHEKNGFRAQWTIESSRFTGNVAPHGGAIQAWGLADVIMSACSFEGNTAQSGGAIQMLVTDNTDNVLLLCAGTEFIGNTANGTPTANGGEGGGGAVYLGEHGSTLGSATGHFHGCVFGDNVASSRGGAVYGENDSGSINLNSCVLVDNRASTSSGAVGTGSPLANRVIVRNSTLVGNTRVGGGGGLSGTPSTSQRVNYYNCITRANGSSPFGGGTGGETTTVVRRCIVEFPRGPAANANLAADPRVVDIEDPTGPDGLWLTEDDGLRIGWDSPALDYGDNTLAGTDPWDLDGDGNTAEAVPFDALGLARFQDDPHVTPNPGVPGQGYLEEVIDVGAYEGAATTRPVCYPDCNEDGQLNTADLICFQTRFALGDPYADCDGNGVLNINDFICFQTSFALGCP